MQPLELLRKLGRTSELFGDAEYTAASRVNYEDETACGRVALELASLRSELEAKLSEESEELMLLEERLREEQDERMATRQLLVEADEHASELENAFLKLTLECAEAKEIGSKHLKRATELEYRLSIAEERARSLETQVQGLAGLVEKLRAEQEEAPWNGVESALKFAEDLTKKTAVAALGRSTVVPKSPKSSLKSLKGVAPSIRSPLKPSNAPR